METIQRNAYCAIVGGSGFLGRVLTNLLLAQGWKVKIIDIARPVDERHVDLWMKGDVCDPVAMRAAFEGMDIVINLAAAHRDDIRPVDLYDRVNVDGARNVCLAAEATHVKHILFTSSVAVYGLAQGTADEQTLPKPFNDYGRTKLLAEKEYLAWAAKDGSRQLTIVRPTVIFGPGNRGNVYVLMNQLARGRFVMVGKGENRKSMAYVDNVAAFLFHCLQKPPLEKILNYVDQPDFSMRALVDFILNCLGRKSRVVTIPYKLALALGDMADFIARLTGKSLPFSRVRVEKFCANTVFKADKVRENDFHPPVDLETALKTTIAYEFPQAAS